MRSAFRRFRFLPTPRSRFESTRCRSFFAVSPFFAAEESPRSVLAPFALRSRFPYFNALSRRFPALKRGVRFFNFPPRRKLRSEKAKSAENQDLRSCKKFRFDYNYSLFCRLLMPSTRRVSATGSTTGVLFDRRVLTHRLILQGLQPMFNTFDSNLSFVRPSARGGRGGRGGGSRSRSRSGYRSGGGCAGPRSTYHSGSSASSSQTEEEKEEKKRRRDQGIFGTLLLVVLGLLLAFFVRRETLNRKSRQAVAEPADAALSASSGKKGRKGKKRNKKRRK